jgi:hypothetical protein
MINLNYNKLNHKDNYKFNIYKINHLLNNHINNQLKECLHKIVCMKFNLNKVKS